MNKDEQVAVAEALLSDTSDVETAAAPIVAAPAVPESEAAPASSPQSGTGQTVEPANAGSHPLPGATQMDVMALQQQVAALSRQLTAVIAQCQKRENDIFKLCWGILLGLHDRCQELIDNQAQGVPGIRECLVCIQDHIVDDLGFLGVVPSGVMVGDKFDSRYMSATAKVEPVPNSGLGWTVSRVVKDGWCERNKGPVTGGLRPAKVEIFR